VFPDPRGERPKVAIAADPALFDLLERALPGMLADLAAGLTESPLPRTTFLGLTGPAAGPVFLSTLTAALERPAHRVPWARMPTTVVAGLRDRGIGIKSPYTSTEGHDHG
jgi:hypothetical protein